MKEETDPVAEMLEWLGKNDGIVPLTGEFIPGGKEDTFPLNGDGTPEHPYSFCETTPFYHKSEIEFESGIKMITWSEWRDVDDVDVRFGSDNRINFVYKCGEDTRIITLFDGSHIGMYQRSVIKNDDRISIVYIPHNLLITLENPIPGL